MKTIFVVAFYLLLCLLYSCNDNSSTSNDSNKKKLKVFLYNQDTLFLKSFAVYYNAHDQIVKICDYVVPAKDNWNCINIYYNDIGKINNIDQFIECKLQNTIEYKYFNGGIIDYSITSRLNQTPDTNIYYYNLDNNISQIMFNYNSTSKITEYAEAFNNYTNNRPTKILFMKPDTLGKLTIESEYNKIIYNANNISDITSKNYVNNAWITIKKNEYDLTKKSLDKYTQNYYLNALNPNEDNNDKNTNLLIKKECFLYDRDSLHVDFSKLLRHYIVEYIYTFDADGYPSGGHVKLNLQDNDTTPIVFETDFNIVWE